MGKKMVIFKIAIFISFILIIAGIIYYKTIVPVQHKDIGGSIKESPCPSPYVRFINPQSAAIGEKVVIEGWGFGSDAGEVLFANNISARVITWQYRWIEVFVPLNAVTGDIIVRSACSSQSKKQSSTFFKVLAAPSSQ